jgi:hypothetical protein
MYGLGTSISDDPKTAANIQALHQSIFHIALDAPYVEQYRTNSKTLAEIETEWKALALANPSSVRPAPVVVTTTPATTTTTPATTTPATTANEESFFSKSINLFGFDVPMWGLLALGAWYFLDGKK